MFSSAAPKPGGFSFGSSQTSNAGNNNQQQNSFSFGTSKPNIFGNSQTSRNTTTDALSNGSSAPSSGLLIGGSSAVSSKPAFTGFSFGNTNQSNSGSSAPGGLFNNKPPLSCSNDLLAPKPSSSSISATGSLFGGQSSLQQQQSQLTTTNPYGLALPSTQSAEMPKSLTSVETKSDIVKSKSSSSVSQQKSSNLTGSLSILSKVTNSLKIPNRYTMECVTGIFSQSRPSTETNDRDGSLTTSTMLPSRKRQTPSVGLNRSSGSQSQYRRLIIRNPSGSFKNYQDIDPNQVLLKSRNVSRITKPSTKINKFKPFVKERERKLLEDDLDKAKKEITELTHDNLEEQRLIPEDYWCSPSIEELSKMTTSDLNHIENFTAGRYGYGQVSFLYPVDLTSFNGDWGLLLGKCIVFKPKLLLVYPDEFEKPSIGNGLNVPATVSVEKCFPSDKSTKELIKDPSSPEMINYIKRMKNIKGMEFLNYDPVTGTYTFRVDHFSIWGLVDEEEDDPEIVAKFKKQQEDKINNEKRISELKTNTLEKISKLQQDEDDSMADARSNATYDEDNFIYKRQKGEVVVPGGWGYFNGETHSINSAKSARNKGELFNVENDYVTENGNANSLLFSTESEGEDEGEEEDEHKTSGNSSVINLIEVKPYEPEVNDVDMIALNSPSEYPSSKNWDEQIDLADGVYSVFNNDLYKAKNLQLDSKNINSYLFSSSDSSKFKKIDNGEIPKFLYKKEVEEVLHQDIQRAEFNKRIDSSYPKVNFSSNVSLILELQSFQKTDDFQFWELLAILFDDKFCSTYFDKRDEKLGSFKPQLQEKLLDLKRRELLISWIEQFNSSVIHKLFRTFKNDLLESIYIFLCGNDLSGAIQSAVKTRNNNLAVLMSMIDSNDDMVKRMAKSQLDEWSNTSSLKLVPGPVLKIYKLLSGLILSKEYISHLDDLPWSVILLLVLKYGDSNKPLSSLITEFIHYYQRNYSDESSEYFKIFNIYNEPLKVIQTFSIEYQFLMTKKLQSVLNLDTIVTDEIILKFSNKLQQVKLFEESIYVLLHLDSDERTATEVFKVLNDFIDDLGFLNNNNKLNELHNVFQLPLEALHESRANKFIKIENFYSSAISYIDAGLLSKSHELVLDKVAPSFIISKNELNRFENLLLNFKTLPNWAIGGGIYLDYLKLLMIEKNQESKELKELVERLLNSVELLKETNLQVKVARTIIYKKLIHVIFDRGFDYSDSKLLSIDLPPSETNYLRNKIPQNLIKG